MYSFLNDDGKGGEKKYLHKFLFRNMIATHAIIDLNKIYIMIMAIFG